MQYQLLRVLQQTIEAFDGSTEGELRLRFSNGDSLTIARDEGPEGFTIMQSITTLGASASAARRYPLRSPTETRF